MIPEEIAEAKRTELLVAGQVRRLDRLDRVLWVRARNGGLVEVPGLSAREIAGIATGMSVRVATARGRLRITLVAPTEEEVLWVLQGALPADRFEDAKRILAGVDLSLLPDALPAGAGDAAKEYLRLYRSLAGSEAARRLLRLLDGDEATLALAQEIIDWADDHVPPIPHVVERLAHDPYLLTRFGFEAQTTRASAWKIAEGMRARARVGDLDDRRIDGAAYGALWALAQRGDTWAPLGVVQGMMAHRLGGQPTDELVDKIRERLSPSQGSRRLANGIVTYMKPVQGEDGATRWQRRYALPSVHKAERLLAEGIADMAAMDGPEIAPGLRPGFSILAGAAGTGKTTTVRGWVDRLGDRVALTATTGKAAQRLAEVTGRPATTLHEFLRVRPGQIHSRRTDPTDVLVVDEASMIDSVLGGALGSYLSRGLAQALVLVGDPAQLPPVGPGKPFWDLMEAFPERVTTLERVHRQGGRSDVLALATAIRAGEAMPDELGEVRVVEDVLAEFERYRSMGLGEDEIMVLAAERAHVKAINADLHAALHGDRGYVVGDRVIATRTIRLAGGETVWNGTRGTVTGIGSDREAMAVLLEDGREIHLPAATVARSAEHAHCLTIHRAQGSEARAVIVACDPDSRMFRDDRALAYTAVTRARQWLSVVHPEALFLAPGTPGTTTAKRRTALGERIAALLEEEEAL